MNIDFHPDLLSLLNKLALCEDPKTKERIFIGSVRAEFNGEFLTLFVEEEVWETPSGTDVNTAYIRSMS